MVSDIELIIKLLWRKSKKQPNFYLTTAKPQEFIAPYFPESGDESDTQTRTLLVKHLTAELSLLQHKMGELLSSEGIFFFFNRILGTCSGGGGIILKKVEGGKVK